MHINNKYQTFLEANSFILNIIYNILSFRIYLVTKRMIFQSFLRKRYRFHFYTFSIK
ncbi:hypothetical protein EV143_103213 [Flavobacterium chryseum]|nr:hypothetical protein EV143_103213 [Flavobacterium sp. P3160]